MAKEKETEGAAGEPFAEKAGKLKMFECIEKCHWNNIMYYPGDKVEAAEAPEYFKKV